MTHFNVETNPFDLYTHVNCSDISSAPYRSVKFSFSSLSSDIQITPDGFILPWIAFREGINGFVKILRESKSSVSFSDFDTNLLSEFVNDLEEARKEESKTPISIVVSNI